MSCFGWLDVGTFLDEAFVFPMSQFYGEEFKRLFPFFTSVVSLTSELPPFSAIL